MSRRFNKSFPMRFFSLHRFTGLALLALSLVAASAQTRPSMPNNSYLRSREAAVRLASQRYRDAESAALKAKTESDRKSAERALNNANSDLKSAENNLDSAQRDYDRQMDRYHRDLESYQKSQEARKK